MVWRNNFLKQLIGGDTMKDYQHAARLYTDQTFRLAPKNRFLYHVVFDINPLAVGKSINQTEQLELGMIVKRCDLPSYNFNVEQKNKYNLKTYVQTGIQYQPVSIVLHDDMGDVATAFWKSYYQHYIVDTNQSERAYKAGYNDTGGMKRFGLDTGNKEKFFTSISIFQLSRGLFTEYKMMNPIVNDWANGSMDQGDGAGVNEHAFSISYSGVLMRNGEIGVDPAGFAQFHYDKTPSPNSTGGDSVFGVLGGITKTASLLGSGNIFGAGLSALNTYEKIKSGRATRGLNEEIIGIAKDAIKAGTNNIGATSKPGVSFPKNLKQKRANDKQTVKAVGQTIVSDENILLNSTQAKIYLENNFDAKQKFAKFTSFRIDSNLDVNDVDTEWSQLTESEQNSYLNNAGNIIGVLINSEQLKYQVNRNEYQKFVEAPLAEQTVATVNLNNSGSDKGLSANTLTGAKGYTY